MQLHGVGQPMVQVGAGGALAPMLQGVGVEIPAPEWPVGGELALVQRQRGHGVIMQVRLRQRLGAGVALTALVEVGEAQVSKLAVGTSEILVV